MGSSLIKGYDLESKPCCQGGYQNKWQITTATKQDKSKQQVSVFIFDKKEFKGKIESKADQDKALEFLRRQVMNASLANSSYRAVLSILEPLQEDSQSLGFVSE